MVFYTTGREFESLMRRQNVGGASWMGTGLQTHGSKFDSCHLLQILVVLQLVLMYNSNSSEIFSKSLVNPKA